MRKRVSIGAAGGMTHEEISIALGIARATLEKHFERELSIVAHQRKLDALCAMYDSATGAKGMKPNVSAQKAFVAASVVLSAPPVPKGEAVQPDKAEKLGKKEQQQHDAESAPVGTGWANLLKPNATPQ